MDGDSPELSMAVSDVMDSIGGSEEIRHKSKQNGVVMELLLTMTQQICGGNPGIFYVFGSSYEGTSTVDLHSDFDFACLNPKYPVVEHIDEAPESGNSLLIVNDGTTKPGYVKLQFVKDKVPQTINVRTPGALEIADESGRICCKHLASIKAPREYSQINGPAATRSFDDGSKDIDLVTMFRCNRIPKFANSWIERGKQQKWPTGERVSMMKEQGCFFVGINHPKSENQPIEWRLSFSLQERLLMLRLNSTQHKVYILLKIMKRDIFNKRVPKSLSSYHLKTCLFYTIERNASTLWEERTILRCLFLCIERLYEWTQEANCPNFFIPEENMFDRVERNALREVHTVLSDILSGWCNFVWFLDCDAFGIQLRQASSSGRPLGDGADIKPKSDRVCFLNTEKCVHVVSNINRMVVECMRLFVQSTALEYQRNLERLLEQLQNTWLHPEHSEEERQIANSFVSPHIHLQITQCSFVNFITFKDKESRRILFERIEHHVGKALPCDTISTFLVQMSFCLWLDILDGCEELISRCESALKPYVISVCGCSQNTFKSNRNQNLFDMISKDSYTTERIKRECTASCISFLPSQSILIPQPLQLEQFRYPNIASNTDDSENEPWFDWIVVDSKVYLNLLKYIFYSKIGNIELKLRAIHELKQLIETDDNLGHIETAYNLLGWIHAEENRPNEAMACFVKSMKRRPTYNAAIWHILLLLHVKVN